MTMLKRFIALLAMVTALSLVACSGTNQEGGTQGESQPVRIGTVFTATDTLDPSTTTSLGGMTVIFHVYDALVIMTADGPVMSLAESVEPNQTADEWTITLRDGAKYSTGNPVTGQDVFASLQYLSQSPNFSFMYSTIDFAASTVEEQRVTLKLVAPAADFVESVLGMFSSVAPDGKFEGIGAGPYVVDQGDATTGFQLSANENYWAGRPAIPQITLVPIPDANSRATALQSGEIDYALGLDSSGLNALSGAKDIVIPEETLDSAGALELVLNTRVAPFNNPELRRAAKLAIDREKMVSTLLGDIGEVGNDLLGKGYPGYSDSIAQTAVNKNEAKKIFAEHGVSSFTIVASDVLPGLVASAELMAQEFAEVGVTVTIEKMDPQNFFAQLEDVYQASAFTFYWTNRPAIAEYRITVGPNSFYNVSGYTSETLVANFVAVTATLDDGEQARLVEQISQELHDQGGDLIWGFQRQVAAHRAGLDGVVITQALPILSSATFTPEG